MAFSYKKRKKCVLPSVLKFVFKSFKVFTVLLVFFFLLFGIVLGESVHEKHCHLQMTVCEIWLTEWKDLYTCLLMWRALIRPGLLGLITITWNKTVFFVEECVIKVKLVKQSMNKWSEGKVQTVLFPPILLLHCAEIWISDFGSCECTSLTRWTGRKALRTGERWEQSVYRGQSLKVTHQIKM